VADKVVSGTLNPDWTGTYTEGATVNGYPSWSDGAGHHIYYFSGFYVIFTSLGAPPGPPFAAYWQQSSPGTDPDGTYNPSAGATGTATVADDGPPPPPPDPEFLVIQAGGLFLPIQVG